MANCIFLAENLVDTATLSIVSGTADAQYPVTNIAHDFSTKVFRSTGTSCSILIDTLAVNAVDYIAIRGSQIDGLGFTTATIEGSATTTFSGTPVSIDISAANNFAFKSLTSSSLRYWKLVLTGSSYVEVSNIYLGLKTQMSDNNINLGWSYKQLTNNKVSTNNFGQRFIDTYGFTKTIQGDIKYANATEFDQLNNIQLSNGENKPIWFLLDSTNAMSVTDSKYLFSGMFYMSDLTWKSVAPSLFDVNVTLTEAM